MIPRRYFRWIVATVEVKDPWGGVYPHIPTRHVILRGPGGRQQKTNAMVRLFENRQNVLPLVCFDTDVEDVGILMQIQEGLHSVLLNFFEENVRDGGIYLLVYNHEADKQSRIDGEDQKIYSCSWN